MAGPLLLRSLLSASTLKSFSSHLAPLPRFSRCFSSGPASAAAAATTYPSAYLDPGRLRNVAVIAHVDHGKTTLMDRLLRQCGADIPHERAMDSISLERERGITIASKVFFFFTLYMIPKEVMLSSILIGSFNDTIEQLQVTSVSWKENELNMVDTPGHADFGGEVERVVGMVEGAVLVVDAGEGPLAQTKFVLAKALKYGLRPLLLLNKVDRPSVSEERCNEVESLVFDLFANLGATEEQLDFPVLYASAKEGWASSTFTKDPPAGAKNMSQLLDAIVRHVPPPKANLDGPFQMLVSMMEKDFYLGRILTGRVSSGIVRVGDKIHGLRSSESGIEKIEEGKVCSLTWPDFDWKDCERELQLLTVENFCITWTGRAGGKCRIWVVKLMKKKGTSMVLIDSAGAGDIISMAGLGSPSIGHTVANTEVCFYLVIKLSACVDFSSFSVN
ncbi:hypothetical protein Godav_002313 [Gossypium davidsonii]|uniref:Tr-type G domain-containing protein n=1 Tax=Gossypium davidsonii TaxID=34287 RepID=A0A7J8SWK4_GOSDV|nr:hypothetical protein [Gossypium davidsonii]